MTFKVKTVIKRDGTEVPFDLKKFKKVISWACEGDEPMIRDMLDTAAPRLRERVKTNTIMGNLIDIAAKKISLINPSWEFVASKLLLLQKYHTKWPEVKFHKGEYPPVEQVFTGQQYSSFMDKFEPDEIERFNDAIQQDRDFLFKYAGLYYMFDKYTIKNELPQHVYMRIAMFLHSNEDINPSGRDKLSRADRVVDFYEYLSQHYITTATPVTVNSGTAKPQLASCVLSQMGDSAESIMQTAEASAIYSKHKGGIAVDGTKIRPVGAHISGNNGVSSGPVPFIKLLESTITSFSQGGSRIGAMVFTFDWTHPNVFEMIALKRVDGTEETRARHLKYSMRINDVFMDFVRRDLEVKLIDPHKYPRIADTFGDEWKDVYNAAKPEKIVRARDIWFQAITTRVDTGNLYLFHTDNVNNNTRLDRFINSSNLCVHPDTKVLTDMGYKRIADGGVHTIWNGEEWSEGVKFLQTGSGKKLIRLTIDNLPCDSVMCTPEHTVYIIGEDGKEVKTTAGEVEVGDEIPKWHEQHGLSHITSIEEVEGLHDTWCFTEPKRNRGVFNGMLLGNCQEILQPSRASDEIKSTVSKDFMTGKTVVQIERQPQEISLCTLSSVNFQKWATMDSKQQQSLASALVRALDNSFELAFYPVPDAAVAAKDYRYLGIGIFNYAYAIAEAGLVYSSDDALDFVSEHMLTFEEATEQASHELAKERGPFPKYTHGDFRRNALIRAIAPTASSARTIGGTESAEPIQDFFVRLGGTANLPWIAPEFKKLNRYYEKAFDIDYKWIFRHVALRQVFLDQGQSVNMYASKEEASSSEKLFEMHDFAFKMGIKTLYYMKTEKSETEEVCESCS